MVELRFIRLNTTQLTLCKNKKRAASHGFIIFRAEICTLASTLLARLCCIHDWHFVHEVAYLLIRIIWVFGLVNCIT
ncbi:hypothetical protein TGAM01_v200424 [Trichoderma gamsii]|uniref:Uncharacterized protein n=1 Tax=Trichoderma gamsii TaxID=398673 RepID=A0A2P5A3A3_9HYPO|nr:hypothetical protein TGAM01_v200424 [Trichoderma gamsii]PON31004.1 hypothetical protein TGAM01_v200424 [Trichoderma gamsii]